MASIPELQQTNPYLAEVEGFRTMARLHGVPTGTPECVAALPLRLAQDWRMRGNFVELLRELQRKDPEFSLPDALDVLLRAVGGPTASPNRRRTLDEFVDLTAAFLASLGGWPGPEEEPITDLDHPSDHDPRLDRAFVAAAQTSDPAMDEPEQDTAPEAEVEPDAEPGQDAEPAKAETPAGISLAEITQALARLERGSVDLRLHLDSIDQRLSRMEPLLESPATIAADPPPPVTPARSREPEPVTPPQAQPPIQPRSHDPSPAEIFPERELVRRSDSAPAVSPTPMPSPVEPSASAVAPPVEAPSRPLTPRRDRFAAAMELPGTRSALHFPAHDEALHFSAAESSAPVAEALAERSVAPAAAPPRQVQLQSSPAAVTAAPFPAADLQPIAPARFSSAPAASDGAPAAAPAAPEPAAPARTTSFAAAAALTAERQLFPQQARVDEVPPPALAAAPVSVPVPTTTGALPEAVSLKTEATPDLAISAGAPALATVPAPIDAAPREAVAWAAATPRPNATTPIQAERPTAATTPASLNGAAAAVQPAAPATSPGRSSPEAPHSEPASTFGGVAVPHKPASTADSTSSRLDVSEVAESDDAARRSRGPLVVGIVAALLIALAAFLLLRGKPLPFLLDKPNPANTTVDAPATRPAREPAVTLSPARPAPAGCRRARPPRPGNGLPTERRLASIPRQPLLLHRTGCWVRAKAWLRWRTSRSSQPPPSSLKRS